LENEQPVPSRAHHEQLSEKEQKELEEAVARLNEVRRRAES